MDPFTGILLVAGFLAAIFVMVEALRKLRDFSVRVMHSLIAMMRQAALRIVAMMSVFCLDFVPAGLAGTRTLFLSMRYWPLADRLAVCAFLGLLISCPIVWIKFGGLNAYVAAGVTLLGSVSWILLRRSPSVVDASESDLRSDDCNPIFDAGSQLQNGHHNGPAYGTTTNDTKGDVSEERRSVEALQRILSKKRLSRGDRDECKTLIDKLVKTLKCTRETVESLRALLNGLKARVAARKTLNRQLDASITRLKEMPPTDGAPAQVPASASQELHGGFAAVDRLLEILESSSSSEEDCLRAAGELGDQRCFSENQLERLSALYEAILDDAELSSSVAEAVGLALIHLEARLESFRITTKRPR